MSIIFGFFRILFSLRYKITIRGLDHIENLLLQSKKGALFLPNHPAEIDPVILMLNLWKKFRLRPLIVEHFYYLKGFRFFIKLVKALPLPDMNHLANKWKIRQVEKLLENVSQSLQEGSSFLIYPAGKLKHTGLEVVGGSSFVYNLIEKSPDLNVILIRTTGLWGSSFSRALTGQVPNFSLTFWNGIKILFKNLLFFTPRRPILIEFSLAEEKLVKSPSRLEFNKLLEEWYNQYPLKGEEPLSLVSYCFYKDVFPSVARIEQKVRSHTNSIEIPQEKQQQILLKVADLSGRSIDLLTKESHLSYDLGLDSLDIADLFDFLDERFGVESGSYSRIQYVGDLFELVGGIQEVKEEKPTPLWKWRKRKSRPHPSIPEGSLIQEVFFSTCRRMGSHIACVDRISGAFSYRKLKQIVLTLALKLREIEGDYVGILFPSSNLVYALILATLIAKKTPVMLNWTAGVRSLDHAGKICHLKTVLSSRRFLNELENGDLGSLEDKILLLEDVKDSISLMSKLKAAALSLLSNKMLLSFFGLQKASSSDSAVILFTSGTESLPKAVPLSHHNILSNQKAAFSCSKIGKHDILYGVLPPFHSFGFSVTGLLPLLAGVRVCYAPDPTNSREMARDIFHWQVSIICSAPSFIKSLLHAAKPGELSSLRLFVAGAEKIPQDLFDQVASLEDKKQNPKNIAPVLIEGYGITECSPIVTLNRPHEKRKGVGRAIPGVELLIIDPSSNAVLPYYKEGEICIHGPNVFSGYLGTHSSCFIDIFSKRWYRSGDRGYLEEDGSLFLTGRMKRFVKIGGEMVSLGGIEEEIIRLAFEEHWVGEKKSSSLLAVSSFEDGSGKPQLVLFSTFDITKEEVNAALKKSGHGRLAKISQVKRVKEIPLTGTGKTYYRLLDEICLRS